MENNSSNDNMDYITKAGVSNMSEDKEPLMDVEINLERLEEALGLFSNKAAPGPDGIPTLCLKKGGIKIKMFLVKLFKLSMDETDVPISLRLALFSPIFKGGDASNCTNYHPIALTGHVSKLFERIIRPQIVEYLEIRGRMDGASMVQDQAGALLHN